MKMLMSPKGNHAGWNPIPWEWLSWDPEPSSHAAEGPSEGLQGEGLDLLARECPMQEERSTHIPGSWVLPLTGLERKNKTGLTESKLIQHEEALKKKKLSLTHEKIDKSSQKITLTRPKIHHSTAGKGGTDKAFKWM